MLKPLTFVSSLLGSLCIGTCAWATPTVSVPEFKNTVTNAWWWQGPVARDLSHALANELQSAGGLQIVERQNINAVLSEQELTELGIVKKNSPTAAKQGQMKGAQYIVLGTITSYDTTTDMNSSGGGMSFLGFGGRKQTTTTKDYVAIDIRVVDSTTGTVVGHRTVEGRASNSSVQKNNGGSLAPVAGLAAAFIPGMGSAGYAAAGAAATFRYDNNSTQSKRTPAAEAIRGAIIEASDYVSCVLTPTGNCLAKFAAKDSARRTSTRSVLSLSGSDLQSITSQVGNDSSVSDIDGDDDMNY